MMNVHKGAIMFADNFRILAGILSRHVALYAFRPLKIEATLSTLEIILKMYLRID